MKLLIVDDESNEREAMCRIVAEAGYEVVSASGVDEAIARLETDHSIALVITDLIMPERTGLELLDHVRFRLRNRKIPVIVCSGVTRSEVVAKALRFGARDFVVKPIAPEQFLEKIRKAISSTRKIVLAVSPDPLELELLTKSVEREGYHVMPVFNGKEALEYLKTGQYYAVMAEVVLPDMSGSEFVAAVKSQKRDLPVVIVVSGRNRSASESAASSGADGVIERPFKNTEIAKMLVKLGVGIQGNREEHDEK